jgi:hypothetical protein
MDEFPTLYGIVRKNNMLVPQVLGTTPLNVSFRRALVGEKLRAWLKLVHMVAPISLNEEEEDIFICSLLKNGSFSVNSFYKDVVATYSVTKKNAFWRAKILLKIKVFLWYFKG